MKLFYFKGKEYQHPVEEINRMKIFFDNKEKVDRHNELHKRGLVNFTLELNKFADLVSVSSYHLNLSHLIIVLLPNVCQIL